MLWTCRRSRSCSALGARFVGWRLTSDGRKLPIDPHTGRAASSTDPDTWADLGETQVAVERDHLTGFGFALAAERDGVDGVDLDACRDAATGVIKPWAQKIIARLASYAEVSPSGTGVKILLRADPVPKLTSNRRAVGKANGAKQPSVEIYTTARYFTLTGRIVDDVPDEIVDSTEAFEELAAWVAKGTKPKENAARSKVNGHDAGHSPFRVVNAAALAAPETWVPALFGGGARENGSGVWRVSSKALGRDREEDLSISPAGIKDFGEHDMGDPYQGRRTAIDLVMEHGGAADAMAAAQWLAEQVGIHVPFGQTGATEDVAPAITHPWPEPPGAEAYHGIVGEIVRRSSRRPRPTRRRCCSSSCRRRQHPRRRRLRPRRGRRHPPRLFMIQVGRTSKGRKGTSLGAHPRRCSRPVAARVGRDCKGRLRALLGRGRDQRCGPATSATTRKASDGDKRSRRPRAWTDKRLLLFEGEIAKALRSMERQGNTCRPCCGTPGTTATCAP